ncbi:MAG: helicase-associated domain-containing protein [Candidatus Hydrogenedentes bacterium]|nr:helicase-associated domain-containing protein [Candidatus Hydrogenedentota bacterium]
MSRPAFRIAKELSVNSRSGLTLRFLSKKIELPQEEIEYLVDVNSRVFFLDLTRVKLVPEGIAAVKRIVAGLENHGDVPSLFRLVKTLTPHDFRRFEEQLGIEKPGGKKAAIDELLHRYYAHPESVVEYVATRGFSQTAQEVFDVLWQSRDGVMPVSRLRAAHGGSDYGVEQALAELVQAFAVFEMFRFDTEDRLVRIAGLLSEVRQAQAKRSRGRASKDALKPSRGKPYDVDSRALDFSDRVCRIVAAIAAKPVRVRGDGDLFREDRRRLEEMDTGDDPSLTTCLWVAQGVGWLARVDSEIRTGNLDSLIALDRISRHRILFDWLTARGGESETRRALRDALDEMKPDTWYPVMDFIEHCRERVAEDEQPVLKNAGGHWGYSSPSASANAERNLARGLEETFLWLGIVDRAEEDDGSVFRVPDLGRCLLSDSDHGALAKHFPERGAEIVVQPNFDIVVPSQDVDPLLTVPLDQFAERASTGLATVYHLSKDSFTRAIQEGHDGGAFVEFLLAHNRGGSLPGNVMTTLDDWRGNMKRVRLRTVHVLESDDPLVMADLMHRRRFRKYFQQVDARKTVAFSKISKTNLAKELEREGFVVE